MKKSWVCVIALLAVWLVGADQSLASRPVQRTITGCVIGGTLYSIHTDVSPTTGKKTMTVYPITVLNMDLSSCEGERIRARGSLLPGDRFQADPKTLERLGPCDEKSRRAIAGAPR